MSKVSDLAGSERQWLSSLADGELDPAQSRRVVERLAGSPGLQARWRRYHLIRDTLQGQLPESLDPDLAGRVSRLVDAEPAIRMSQQPAWLRPLAGVALAASVAAAAIVGIRSLHGGDSSGAPLPVAQQSVERLPQTEVSRDRLGAYLVRHSEYSRGVVPYVHLVSQDRGANR